MKGEALDYAVYTGFAPLKTLAKISFPDRAVMDAAEGAQRELKRAHAKEFAKFIQNPGILNAKKATAPPLIFNTRVKARFHETEDGVGTLTIPDDDHALAQVDGQHRLAETGNVEKSLPFVIYQDLDRTEEVALFTIINDKHEGLTKSLVDKNRAQLLGEELPEKEPHLDIAVKLNEDKKSPWYHLVDTGGEKTPGNKRRVTLRSLQEATREMISGPRCQNASSAKKFAVVMNFWCVRSPRSAGTSSRSGSVPVTTRPRCSRRRSPSSPRRHEGLRGVEGKGPRPRYRPARCRDLGVAGEMTDARGDSPHRAVRNPVSVASAGRGHLVEVPANLPI